MKKQVKTTAKSKKPIVYAFIDSQNLNLGVRSQGWRIDYKKFRDYLKYRHSVTEAFMFIGMVPENASLYTQLTKAGFNIVFKPTVQYIEDGKVTVKGNVDAELVLHSAAIEYDNYDKAVIVSGDGDFRCLVDFLAENDKLLHIIAPTNKYSKLLKTQAGYIIKVSQFRHKVELDTKNDQHRRSVKPIGLSGHGDSTKSVAKKAKKVKKGKS